MAEGFLQAGAQGAAIIDIPEYEGKAAAKALAERYDALVLFYKVNITKTSLLRRCLARCVRTWAVLMCCYALPELRSKYYSVLSPPRTY